MSSRVHCRGGWEDGLAEPAMGRGRCVFLHSFHSKNVCILGQSSTTAPSRSPALLDLSPPTIESRKVNEREGLATFTSSDSTSSLAGIPTFGPRDPWKCWPCRPLPPDTEDFFHGKSCFQNFRFRERPFPLAVRVIFAFKTSD